MPLSFPQITERDDPVARHLQLLRNIRKHWLLAASIWGVIVAATAFYTLGQTKVYRSTATVLIDPSPPRPLGQEVQNVVDLGAGLYLSNHEYYQTQYRIIQSRTIAEETVKRLGLDRDASFVANRPRDFQPADFEPSVTAAAQALLLRLNVSPIKESRLVEVSFDDAQEERARRVVSTLVGIYIDQNVDRALESTRTAGEWLGVQLEKLKAELSNNEQALHEYKRSQNILSVSMDDQNNMLREEMQQLNAELTRVRVEQQRLSARLEQLEQVEESDPSNLPAQELLDSQVLSQLRAMYVAAQQDFTALTSSGKGENHPEVRSAAARVDGLKSALSEEIANIKHAIGRSVTAKRKEANGLAQLFEHAKQKALDLNGFELEYRRLERSKTNTEKLYSVVLERTKESGLTQMMRFNNISVVDEATLPSSPVKPRLPLNLALGAGFGFLLGLMGAAGRAAIDRTIRSPEEIDEALGLPFLGLLPKAKAGQQGRKTTGAPELIPHADPRSNLAEAARALRTNLLFINPDRPKRRILITSAALSEGKTTVACGVAIAMAQAGQKVLLIDCDLRRPRLHRIFGRENHQGVTSALLDPSSLKPGELKTEVPHLSLLTSGPQAPNPAELLQSDRFRALLDQLSGEFDRIVLDSPPLVAVTDSAILSTLVDGTVFVIRGASTRRELAKQAIRTLRDVNAELVGVVLNGADMSKGSYGGYYQYEYYGTDRKEDRSRSVES